jgi:hypothetical protein
MAFLYIDRDECIGDSLGKINDNAFNFDQRITTNTANLSSLTTVVNAVSSQTVIIQDVKADALPGGTATAGSWIRRVLNTSVNYPTSLIVTLTSNTFTLPQGTWLIRASAPANRVDKHQIRLVYTTTGLPVTNGLGTSEFSFAGRDGTQSRSHLEATITLNGSTPLAVEHRVLTTRNNDGFGIPVSFGGYEVYTTVTCSKVG